MWKKPLRSLVERDCWDAGHCWMEQRNRSLRGNMLPALIEPTSDLPLVDTFSSL